MICVLYNSVQFRDLSVKQRRKKQGYMKNIQGTQLLRH